MQASDVIRHAVDALNRLGIEYVITGSYASIVHGEPRMTHDIDMIVRLQPRHVPALMSAFPAPAFYMSADAATEAIRQESHFNIIHESGMKIDLYPRLHGRFVQSQFNRAISIKREVGYEARFLSAEDIVVSKMRFYREGESERQLLDIVAIVKRQGDRLDRGYIERWVQEFNLLDLWREILDQAE